MERVNTVQKMKCSIKDFFSKSDQIRSFLRLWSHLLKKPLMENLAFCAVNALIVTIMFDAASLSNAGRFFAAM